MIGKIEEIIDNSVTIKLDIDINEQPNLVNLHVVFEDDKKKEKKNVSSKTSKKQTKKNKRQKKHVKIRYGRIALAILILLGIGFILYHTLDLSIRNIYVKNNHVLTDQQVIERAQLQDYPSTVEELSFFIESRLEDDIMIKSADVKKNGLFSVTITVEENRPLFYDINKNKVILLDGQTTDGNYVVPTLINYTPDKLYKKLQKKLAELDTEILIRISEIEYNPNEVDQSRFLLSMTDGNYVYLSLNQFQKINSYLDIMKTFQNKKGILYLDSGEYFRILEN